jgi:hypothetical protein
MFTFLTIQVDGDLEVEQTHSWNAVQLAKPARNKVLNSLFVKWLYPFSFGMNEL